MPSATHENFVLLFRNHPELTFELARRAGVRLSDRYDQIEDVATEFEDPVSGTVVRTDLAFVGHQDGRPRHGLAIEVQLGPDPNKQWTLVIYRGGLRRRHHCPAWTLWFTPEPAVRASVYEQMFLEEPELRPQVVTPAMIPIIRDLDQARANYPWAVLAACMHACGPEAVLCATLAIRALLSVAPKDYEKYLQLIAANVGEDVMQQVREQLGDVEREELSAWERRGSSFVRGRAEGHAEGHAEGLAEGHAEGHAEGLRSALRTVLEVRGLSVDEQTQARIEASSADELSELIARAATSTSIADLFGPAAE